MRAHLLVPLAIATGLVHAQSATGAYTAEQAQAGRDLYASQCATCHLPTLAGAGNSPPLAGANFLATWRGKPVSELYARIKSSMPPQGNPALTDADFASLVAFVLQSNNVP